jgi:hypothetical protein
MGSSLDGGFAQRAAQHAVNQRTAVGWNRSN